MEAQLQSLIDKIKNDGVAEAEKKANIIITNAEAKAEKTIKNAEVEAIDIIKKANDKAAKAEDAGKKAIEQAGRNLIVSLKQSIIDLFNSILKREIRDSLAPNVISAILLKVVTNWNLSPDNNSELEVLLNPKDIEQLTDNMLSVIKKEAQNGIMLKPSASVDAGFRIVEKDGNMYYDFTERGLTEILTQYLNPGLAGILKCHA